MTLANGRPAVAYVGATLPTLSETFVSNELLAVRRSGVCIVPVSVLPPRVDNLNPALRSLAEESIRVYGVVGWAHAAAEIVGHPLRSSRTLGTATRDAMMSGDAAVRSRLKAPVQAIAALGLARRLRRAGIGHLHAHMANTPTTIAMYAAAQLGIGFSFTGHANDLFVHRTFLPEKLRRAAFVACISRWHREFYRRFADLSEERMPVIRCGVDAESSAAGVPCAQRPDEPLRILSVGRLVAKKGMDTLIRAIAEVGSGAPIHCEIVGDGPQRAELSALIAALGIGDLVSLLGARPNVDVLERVQACDVFVLACRRDVATGDQDGIPVSLMEAMAANVCVVTSDLPPIDELVIDGRTGLCVPAGDAAALAAALSRLARDPDLRASLARNGRDHVRQHFDRRTNVEKLAGMFRAAAASTTEPAPPRAAAAPTSAG